MTSSCWSTCIFSFFLKFRTDQLPGCSDLTLHTVNASGFGPVSRKTSYLTCWIFYFLSNAIVWLYFNEPLQEYSFCKSNATRRGALEIFPAVTDKILKAHLSTEVCTLLPLHEFSISRATELVTFWILVSKVCCSSQSVVRFRWCIGESHSCKEPACRHV